MSQKVLVFVSVIWTKVRLNISNSLNERIFSLRFTMNKANSLFVLEEYERASLFYKWPEFHFCFNFIFNFLFEKSFWRWWLFSGRARDGKVLFWKKQVSLRRIWVCLRNFFWLFFWNSCIKDPDIFEENRTHKRK